jgi:hypothetical protein
MVHKHKHDRLFEEKIEQEKQAIRISKTAPVHLLLSCHFVEKYPVQF